MLFYFATSGTAGNKECLSNGVTVITGGTGIADMTIPAPSPGYEATIRINTISSGTVVVATPTGVTFDGTNNRATLDAANEAITLVWVSPTSWGVKFNIGGVVFSAV